MAMPFISTMHVGSTKFRILSERLFFFFVADMMLLTWVGQTEILDVTVSVGQYCTLFLFFYLVVVYPFLSYLESYLYLNGINLFAKQS